MATKKEKHTLAYVLVAIVAIALIGHALTWWAIPGVPPFQTTGTGPAPAITTADKDNYLKGIGVFEVSCQAFDSCDPGTTRTIGTDCNVYWYHYTGGAWTPDTGAWVNSTTQYYTAKPADNGFAWIMVKSVTHSQASYLDCQKMIGADSYITSYQYVDVDGDGARDFIFQYDLKNHAIPSSGYPVISFTTWLLTYDASFTLNNFANQSVGTGSQTTKYYEWYLAMSAEKKGAAIYKVQLVFGNSTVNCVDETLVHLKNMQIPGIGTLDGSQFNKDFTSIDIRYTYTIASNFNGADYLKLMPNANNKFYMNTQLEWTLGATTEVPVTLTIYFLVAPTEAGTSTSDTFYATLA